MRSLNLYLCTICLSTALMACEAANPDQRWQINSCRGSLVKVRSIELLNRTNPEEYNSDVVKESYQSVIEECGSLSEAAFMEMAHKALLSSLRDPDSAKLENPRIMVYKEGEPLPYTYVGKVNAKNAYGGYTGYKAFEVSIDIEEGEWSVQYPPY